MSDFEGYVRSEGYLRFEGNARRPSAGLLSKTPSRHWRALLLVADVHRWRGDFRAARSLQEIASGEARTDTQLATIRQHIGKRLFDEAAYAETAEQFTLALELRRSVGTDPSLIESTTMALRRARELLGRG